MELVVARCGEDGAWMHNIPRTISLTVYDKQTELPFPGSRQLPNVGREAHTYLSHIVERYHTLAELTVFCQGKPFDHAYDFHATLRELVGISSLGPSFRWLGHLVDWDDCLGRRLFIPWSKNLDRRELDVRGFHQALFGEQGPDTYTFRSGAQFAVTKEAIRFCSLEFYQRALNLTEEFPDAAHCLERMWDRVFGVEGIPADWRGQTRHLKPVKDKQSYGSLLSADLGVQRDERAKGLA